MDKSTPQDITIIPYTTFQKPTSNGSLGLATTLRHIVPIQESHLYLRQSTYDIPSTGSTTPLFLNSPLPSPKFKAVYHQKEDPDIDEEGIFALTELNSHNVTMISLPQDIATSTSIIEQHTVPLDTSPTAMNNSGSLAESGSIAPYTQEGNVITSLDLGNHYTHHSYYYHHLPTDDYRRPHKRSSPEDDDSNNDDGDSSQANTALAQAAHPRHLSGSWGHHEPKGKPNQYKRQRRDDTNDVAAAAALTTSSSNPSTPSRETSVGSVLVPEDRPTQAPGADTAVQEKQPEHRFPSLPPITSITSNQESRENSVSLRVAAARTARGRSQLEDGEIDSVYGDMSAGEIRDVAAYPVASTKRSGITSINGLEEGEIRSYVGDYTDHAASANTSKHDLPMLTTTTATREMYRTDKLEHGDTPWSAVSSGNGEREMSQDLASLSLEATTEVAAPPQKQEKWAWQQADAGRGNDDAHTAAKISPQRNEAEHNREKAERKKQSTIHSPSRLPQVEVVIPTPPPRAGLRRSSTGTTTSTHTITTNTPRGPRPLAASSVTALPTTGDSSHNDIDMNLDSNDNSGEETSSDDTPSIRFLTMKLTRKDKGKGKEVVAQPRQSSPVGSVVSIDDSDTDDDAFVVNKGKSKARQAMMVCSPDLDISDDDHHMEQVDHQPEEMDPEGERKWLDFIRDSSDEDTSQAVNEGKTVVQKNDKDNTRRTDKQRTKKIRQQNPHRRLEEARGGGRTTSAARTHVASAKRSTVGNINARAGPSNARHRAAQPTSSSDTTRSGNGRTQAHSSKTWDELVLGWADQLDEFYDENRYADESPPSFGNSHYYAIKEILNSIEEMKDTIPVGCLGQSFGMTPMIKKMEKNQAVEYTIRKQARELYSYFLERWRTEQSEGADEA